MHIRPASVGCFSWSRGSVRCPFLRHSSWDGQTSARGEMVQVPRVRIGRIQTNRIQLLRSRDHGSWQQDCILGGRKYSSGILTESQSISYQLSFSFFLGMLPDFPVLCQEREVDVVGSSRSGACPAINVRRTRNSRKEKSRLGPQEYLGRKCWFCHQSSSKGESLVELMDHQRVGR